MGNRWYLNNEENKLQRDTTFSKEILRFLITPKDP